MVKTTLFKSLFLIFFLSAPAFYGDECKWMLPIQTSNRFSWGTVRLTPIGRFGLVRKARPGIPAHLHTGTDLRRPADNYLDEPVYPAACGKALSVRTDGPFSQIIIEHPLPDTIVWTVYEHVAGILVLPGENVSPQKPIARFMTREELDRFGWQFDHVHFEVLKVNPKPYPVTIQLPHYYFSTYNLDCYSESLLNKYYFNPRDFFEKNR